jgi:hypothetical protein
MYVLISHSFPLPNPTGLKMGEVAKSVSFRRITWWRILVERQVPRIPIWYLVKNQSSFQQSLLINLTLTVLDYVKVQNHDNYVNS